MNRAYLAQFFYPIRPKNCRTPLWNSRFLGRIGQKKGQNRPAEHYCRHYLDAIKGRVKIDGDKNHWFVCNKATEKTEETGGECYTLFNLQNIL